MGRQRAGNIVLDIDGTLIDSIQANQRLSGMRAPDFVSEWGDYIYFRPGLELFLTYCFDRFENVAIWTAASPEWAETILQALQPMLHRVREQTGRKRASSLPIGASTSHHTAGLAESSATSGLRAKVARPGPLATSEHNDMFSFVFTKNRCSAKLVKDESSSLLYEYHTKPLRKVWRSSSLRSSGWTPANTLILEDTPENCISNYGNALYISTFKVMQEARGRRDSALQTLVVFLDRLHNVEDVRPLDKRDWERMFAAFVPQSQPAKPAPLKKQARSAPVLFEEEEEPSSDEDEQILASESICGVLITPRAHYTIYSTVSHRSAPRQEAEESDDDESASEASDATETSDLDEDSDIEPDSDYENDISNARASSLPVAALLHRLRTKRNAPLAISLSSVSLQGKEGTPVEGL